MNKHGEQRKGLTARRVGAWLIWWVLLMAFWVWADDSIMLAELVAGAIVAAAGASVAELSQHQAGSHIRIRIEWLVPALKLPLQVLQDTIVVLGALWRQIVLGQAPRSGFELLPVRYGDDTAEGVTRRALLIGGKSVAPNTYALGIDADRQALVVHHLVMGARRKVKSPETRGEKK
jgi:multisubunit Na+/H+ antiporter MnhE subunit